MKRRGRPTLSYDFEMEHGSSSVTYVIEYRVTPGEKERGPTYDCGGTPGSAPGIDSKAAYYEQVVLCATHRGVIAGRATCRVCKRTLEPRPELDDVVDDDVLLEYARSEGGDDGPDPDDEADRRREMREERDR